MYNHVLPVKIFNVIVTDAFNLPFGLDLHNYSHYWRRNTQVYASVTTDLKTCVFQYLFISTMYYVLLAHNSITYLLKNNW